LESRQIKVLIVEDHRDMRELVRLILESLDYVPIVASHGKEGLEKAISENPKLILMDIRMPIMDGWQAAIALRANPKTKNIPILATSAGISPRDLAACLEAGCNGYIIKPFSILDLQSKISELLAAPIAEL
jgi:two-component system cell cycle response regulator DivK